MAVNVNNGTSLGSIVILPLRGEKGDGVEEVQAQIDNIEAQIDQLIAPTGEAPTPAEIENARVGASSLGSVQYSTLGEAIRGQVDVLAEDISARSKSVEDAFADLGDNFAIFQSGYYRLASSGSTVTGNVIKETFDNHHFVCAKINCQAGDQITINGNGHAGIARLYAFVKSNNTVIYLSNNSLTGKRTVTAPADTAYILINIYATSESYYAYKGELSSETALKLSQIFDNTTAYTFKDFIQGGITSTGEDGSSFIYCKTDFIDIESFKSFYKPSGELGALVYMYDSNKTYLDRVTSYIASTERDLNREQIMSAWGRSGETKYIRFTAKRDVNGQEVASTPDDIINAGLKIAVYGVADNIYNKILTLESKMESTGEGGVPEYYKTHLLNKVNTINGISDSIGISNDNFMFLTDYHWQSNAKNSLSLIKHIVDHTGITKLYFGGDAGMSSLQSDKYQASRLDAEVYSKLWDCVPNFYGILGNHEWNDRQDTTHEASKQSGTYSRQGVVNFYLRREQKLAEIISNEGNYYVDNAGSKIRYIFLQDTGQARVTNETCEWLRDQLNNVPSGYYVIVLSHASFDGWAHVSDHELYYGDRCRMSVLRISQLLGAYKTRATGHIDRLADYFNEAGSSPFVTGEISYDFSNANGEPICLISGHAHRDYSRKEYGVWIIATTTDAYKANEDVNTARDVGTETEQAFDVFQIDITNRDIHVTRIGGGSDRSFEF